MKEYRKELYLELSGKLNDYTRLFFDLIDRRYNKGGNYNIMFASNMKPASWRHNFNEDDSLLCVLDRIFDDATDITILGESFRGKSLSVSIFNQGD